MKSKSYTSVELARLANVTERTLRYYDEIALLVPKSREESGKRIYGLDELYRLQQILLYREMGFSLDAIKEILDDPGFDLIGSLKNQRQKLEQQRSTMGRLIVIVDKTIKAMQDNTQPLSDKDLYDGLSQQTIDEYKAEAEERWGDEFRKSEARIRQMSKAEIQELKAEGDQIIRKLVHLMKLDPADSISQLTIAEYFNHLNQWNQMDRTKWATIAEMYVEDERFRTNYDKYAKGLALWIRDAVRVFSAQS
ncbi:MAG: MerR family transcriptional regulator [Flavobacteriales bacterium]